MREGQEEGEFISVKIHTNENGSDMLMKPLPIDRRQDYSTLSTGVTREFVRNMTLLWEKLTVFAYGRSR